MKDTVSLALAMRCLFMENNKNYQKILLKTIENLSNENNKPTLLLHVCCGPCSTIPLKQLHNHFSITLMFNNSNIYPKDEHDRRYQELLKFLAHNYPDIKVIYEPYDNEAYNQILEPYGEMPEGHERCRVCFKTRLKQGFEYASKNGYQYYGSVMTISRYKNAQDINKIGASLEKEYPNVKWLYADFKKNNGYEDSLIIIKESEMYFQEYCGCVYSYQKYIEKNQKN